MKNLTLLISFICLFACSNQKALEAKAKHQAQTGGRLNEAQKDTDSLFNDLN